MAAATDKHREERHPMLRLSAAFATVAGAVLAVVLLAVVPRAGGADACSTTVSSASALSSALGSASSGATLCVADGSYGRLAVTSTKAAPGVTIRAEHPGQATIDGATLTGSNITLADLNVTDEITIAAGSSGMTISHNRITGGYLGVDLSSDDQQISDTTIIGNRFVGPFGEDAIRANRYHDGPDADPYGLLVEGNEITGVRENGNHSDCLQAVWVGDGMYFRKNYLHDNRCQGFFIKDQASTVTNVVAEDNLFLRNDAACAQAGCGQPSVFQLFGPMTGLVVRRNTIWTPGGGSPTTLRDGGWGTVTIDSNVIYRPWSDTSAPFGSGYSSTNNVAGTSPEGTWPSTGFSVVASPAFADPAHDDYRTNDGRGVDWAPADQTYGPGGGSTTTPPPPPPPDDTTAPDTTITSGPSGPTNDVTPAFAFASTESDSTFECRVDAGSWGACSSPWTPPTLADGNHTVGVRATDAADNTDASPASRSFTVDTKAPQTAISSAPNGTSDSASATIAFTVDEAGATSECRIDDGAWVACSSPYQLTSLGDGVHTLVVRSRDAAGNVEAPGASASWTVALPDGGDPGTPAGSAPTVDLGLSAGYRSLLLTATASDDHGIDHVDFWVDDARVGSDTEPPFATRVYASRFDVGSHTVSTRAFDATGQAASSARTARVYDTSYGHRWSAGSTELTSDDNGDGAIHLSGRTRPNVTVTVGLTRCDDVGGDVVDRFDLTADDDGRLDLVYAGRGLCVVELRRKG
jgi:Right handed beta helix region/Bacterial Ig domain